VLVGQSQNESVADALDLPDKDRIGRNFRFESVKHVESSLFAHEQVLEVAVHRLLLEVAAQGKQIVLSICSLLQHPHVLLHNAAGLVGHLEVKSVLEDLIECHHKGATILVRFLRRFR